MNASIQIKKETSTHRQIIDQVLELRLLVGFLGQKKQGAWWDCTFLDPTGIRFLEMTFPRTAMPAALRATIDAASSIHDKALGRIGCYHLFRFPPSIEDLIENAYSRVDWATVFKDINSRDSALQKLGSIGSTRVKAPEGPVQVGYVHKILSTTSIDELAVHYFSAFSDGFCCYPYFAEEFNDK
jgi:hypothetical protein